VLYAIPRIKSPSHFMRYFAALQPRLRITIHALTHPPGGTLSLYWLGRLAGVPYGADIRSEAVRRRYLFALAGFGLLNALAVYGLAQALFGERRVGLLAALLWVVAPTTLIHGTFAQDTVYLVFYTLALWLGWRVAATGERPPIGAALLLGALFAALTMLNFSWCLMTAIFALFCLQVGLRRKWSRRELALRALLPLSVMTLLAGAILLHYRLDYWAIYRVASGYVRQWYRFEGPHQWLQALVGGQMDLWLMMGSVTLAAFLAAERQAARDGGTSLARRYLLTTLGVLLLPLLFGPHALKMETARCWNWMLPVPIAFAARGLLRHPAARLLAPGAVAVSGLTLLAMRLFMDFSP
jgi:4-amino-4-deoxy-L-arabinose transferase-like glycosyltransferase